MGADPAHHIERVREIEDLGPMVVCLQNASGADPHAAPETYGAEILPAIRQSGRTA